MAEQVKVFKNLVDQVLSVTATDVVLHTTSATQRAVLRDLDCIGLGKGATLDLDGRTMNSSTDAGVLERTKSLIMGPSSTLKLKFPARPSTGFKGLLFFSAVEGIQLAEGNGIDASFTSLTQIGSGTASVNNGTSGAVHIHSTTGATTFYRRLGGSVYVHDETGTETSHFSFGANSQIVEDVTYLYVVYSGTMIYRRHIETGTRTDLTCTGSAVKIPADNQGAYIAVHGNFLYAKQNATASVVSITNLTTGATTHKTDANFSVGSYSDGGGLVINTSGVPFIVEVGTNYWYYWNLNTDVVTRTAANSQSSTEYGNGFFQIAQGIAVIFGEYDDGATVINTNGSSPVRTRTTKSAGGHSFTLNTTNVNSFGDRFGVAGGVVAIPARSYSAYVAGIDITED
jgi:hypothetical protein